MRALADEAPGRAAVWLSRNYGQHAATLAGMASSGGDWIVTMDEDGQHDPADLGRLLDTAMASRPPSSTPSRRTRRRTGRCATCLARRRSGRRQRARAGGADRYNSYRLMLGEVAAAWRPTPAPASTSTSPWAGSPATSPPARSPLREEGDRPSGYSLPPPLVPLLAHGPHRRHPPAAGGERCSGSCSPLAGWSLAAVCSWRRITGADRRSRAGRPSWSSCSWPPAPSCSRSA